MAEVLIKNATHLYKFNSHLLRTPLAKTIALAPDEMALYQVAGSYTNDFPSAGIIDDTSGYGIFYRSVFGGKTMRKYYLRSTTNPNATKQMWRAVNTSHLPEFVFYQGTYATSASVPSAYPEAYMQIPAYHFKLPTAYQDFSILGASLSFTHGGAICQKYGVNVIASSAEAYPFFVSDCADYTLVPSDSGWRSNWTMPFGVFESLNDDPYRMIADAKQSIVLNTTVNQGNLNLGRDYNGRQIWGPIYNQGQAVVTYQDGYIPVTDTPWVQSVALDSNMIASMNNRKSNGVWIVPTPDVSVSTYTDVDNTNDYPIWNPGSSSSGYAGRWVACSFWGFALRVSISL